MVLKKNVAIVYGGQSGEHEISCRSARFLYDMLSLSYDITLIGVNKRGEWYWQNDSSLRSEEIVIQEIRSLFLKPGFGVFYQEEPLLIDCVFPIIHGSHGEDGRLQALLDMLGLPYVGAPFLSSSICMNKGLLKTIWQREEVSTLPFLLLSSWEYKSLSDEKLKEKLDFFATYPLIIKPSSGGSSLGVSRVEGFSEMHEALQKAFNWDDVVLIEPFGEFREIECALIGKGESIEVYPMGEVIYLQTPFYDYETKYERKGQVNLQIPPHISPELSQNLLELAKKAYRVARCEGFARVDIFIDKKDESFLYVNEINTLPGMTQISLFPKMCLAGGLSLKKLGEKLVEEAFDSTSKPSERITKNFLF